MSPNPAYHNALDDFREARARAAFQKVVARLTGKPTGLLPFDEIAGKLRASGQSYRGLQDIPVDKIKGSVSRSEDYTRDFLPLKEGDRERWAKIKTMMTDLAESGLPPIVVYKIGDAYFVQDGHHRVSVARQLGNQFIEAYVTEIQTRVPLGPNENLEDLILQAEYGDFLDHTRIDVLVPGVNLRVTFPGLYKTLEEHIAVHRYYMGEKSQQEVPYPEAVKHWYETVYLPVVQAIREQGLLHEFPGRTETDLYVWISDHMVYMEKDLGWQLRLEVAAADLAERQSVRPGKVLQRFSRRLYDAILPEELEDQPPADGRIKEITRRDRLVVDILVPVNGKEDGWNALDQALLMARREEASLLGLHVLPDEFPMQSQRTQEICGEFDRRCQKSGISGQMALAVGEVPRSVCERALLTDLVILNLAHPPSTLPLKRLSSGFRSILRRCARPVLAVPGHVTPMDRMLLAYDGSPKADEALFFATYFASRCCFSLGVVTAESKGRPAVEILTRAREYLEAHEATADYITGHGPAADAILSAAKDQDSNLIIMGGYGFSPLLEVILGSTVDKILRAATIPILICQ